MSSDMRPKSSRMPPAAATQAAADAERHEHEGLGHELADQPAVRGAERAPDGELALAPLRPHEQQADDVDAGDGQQQRRRHSGAAAGWAGCRRRSAPTAGRPARSGPGSSRGYSRSSRAAIADICARASSMRDAVLQARDAEEVVAAAVGLTRPDRSKRHPELDGAAQREVERCGQDADDRARRAVERGRLPDDVGARAEVGVPGGVADDRHSRSIRHVVSVVEVAAGDRRDAQRLEEARADAPAAHRHETGRRASARSAARCARRSR